MHAPWLLKRPVMGSELITDPFEVAQDGRRTRDEPYRVRRLYEAADRSLSTMTRLFAGFSGVGSTGIAVGSVCASNDRCRREAT